VAWPYGLNLTTVTGLFADASGTPLAGTLIFTPVVLGPGGTAAPVIVADASGRVVVGSQGVPVSLQPAPLPPPWGPRLQPGQQLPPAQVSVALVATDNAGLSPSNWLYQVQLVSGSQAPDVFTCTLPHSPSPVDFTALVNSPAGTAVYSYVSTAGGAMSGTLELGGSPALQIPAGAEDGDVFVSDAGGNGSWSTLAAAGVATAASVTAETSRAEGAESTNAAAISAETTRAEAAEARYGLKPATTENIVYVSLAPSASDSNDGLSWGSAKATIAGALTALGSSAGIINLGHGTFTISEADGSGNGVTLTEVGTVLQGLGPNFTSITISANATYGVAVKAGSCILSGFLLNAASGYTVTYGVGVTAAVSAEKCTFSDLTVGVGGGEGTMTNCFAVGADADTDIADTNFYNCNASGAAHAGWLIGDGVSGNVLDTRMSGCNVVSCVYGICLDSGGGIAWYGGDFGENTGADIYIEGPSVGDKVIVDGARSENSAALLTGANVGASAHVAIRNYVFQSADSFLVSTGAVIDYGISGSLTLDNVTATNYSGTIALLFLFTDEIAGTDSLTVNAVSLKTTQPLSELFSCYASDQFVSVLVESYTQVTSTGSTTGQFIPGPLRLGPGFTAFTWNGSSRAVMLPVETQTLNSAGAVAIQGVAQHAEITLNANATSSSVTNLYPGQLLSITWIQGSAGGHTYSWPSNVLWAGGLAPANVTGANKQETASFYYDGTYLQQTGTCAGQIPAASSNMAAVSGSASSVTGSSSSSYIMAGLDVTFTPTGTGKVVFLCAGCAGVSAGTSQSLAIFGAYGTGTPPSNGGPAAGSALPQGAIHAYCVPVSATAQAPFTVLSEVTGLTTGTAYWFDLGFAPVGGGTSLLGQVAWVVQEVA
jgi:hypothetical protein